MREEERKYRLALTLLVSAIIFLFVFATIVLTTLIVFVTIKLQLFSVNDGAGVSLFRVTLLIGVTSLVMGAIISALASKIPMKPVNKLITQMNRLASGDFKARLYYGGKIGQHPAVIEITESFNKMAEELENTEMLRGDFINNFSHEFKTPIVSIAGFAKLIKKGNLNEEQKREYLDIIEEESLRLSSMATNVLNMTKYENQSILYDTKEFNLSEQIRSSILTLENKWTKKNIQINLDCDEYMIRADKDMLKHVWINLIDNAIKFSPCGENVNVDISDMGNCYSISVSNKGIEISKEQQGRIFNKFYQGDESHTSEGNGIGLALVKKVIDLHHGNVKVNSSNGVNTFTVTIPKTVY